MSRGKWIVAALLAPPAIYLAPIAAAVIFDVVAAVMYRLTGDREWKP